MKFKLMAITIITCSLLSGVIGTFLMLEFYPKYIKSELTQKIKEKSIKNIVRESIIKENKTISIKSIENEVTNIIKKISPGVVSIVIKKDLVYYKRDPFGFFAPEEVGRVKQKIGGGTGFFITKNGIILTNKHVVGEKNVEYTVITNSGEEYNAKVLALDPLTDLAVIQIFDNYGEEIKSEVPKLEIINKDDVLKIGQFAIAIGNALAEFQNTVTLGIVSGKNRTIIAGDGYNQNKLSGLLQTDAAINPGNSGGPLVDLNGKVIGINTAIASNSNGVGFSIPLSKNKIKYILDSISKYGEIKRPFIGISYFPLSSQIANQLGIEQNEGIYIPSETGSVLKGSSADLSGIEGGDIIIEMNGIKLNEKNDLNSLIQNKIPGDKIKLKIIKKSGESKEIELKLGER